MGLDLGLRGLGQVLIRMGSRLGPVGNTLIPLPCLILVGYLHLCDNTWILG